MPSKCALETCTTHDASHGLLRGYIYHRCRCEACRAAYADYKTARRAKVTAGVLAVATHGLYGYGQGCRCGVCREGARVHGYELLRRKGVPTFAESLARRREQSETMRPIREAARRAERESREKRDRRNGNPMGRPPLSPHLRHGNSAGYVRDHCRCHLCNEWNRNRPSILRGKQDAQKRRETTPRVFVQHAWSGLSRDDELKMLIASQHLDAVRNDKVAQIRELSIDKPLEGGDSTIEFDVYPAAQSMAGGYASIGLCDRCEKRSNDLADGWCPACWAQRERELRALPDEPRVITKSRKQVTFAVADLDATAVPAKVEQVIRKPGRMQKAPARANELIIGPTPLLSQRGKRGLKKTVPRKGKFDWDYRIAAPVGRNGRLHRTGGIVKRDEKFTDEAWMHDGLAGLTTEHSRGTEGDRSRVRGPRDGGNQ